LTYFDISNTDKNWVVKNNNGKIVPSQVIKDGGIYRLAFLADVPALGYNTYFISETKKTEF